MESPQPAATAVFPRSASRRKGAASAFSAPSVSGRGMHMASGASVCRMGRQLSGQATVVSPAPARRAARVHMAAAPAIPRDPATISRWPKSFLCAVRLRTGSARAASETSARRRTSSGSRLSGMPMSRTASLPHTSMPPPSQWPGLAVWNATVTSARTQGENTVPSSAHRPEGMSALIVTEPASRSAFMRSITRAASPSGARERPMPNRQSAHASGRGIASSPRTSANANTAPRARSQFRIASAVRGCPTGRMMARPPFSANRRAAA